MFECSLFGTVKCPKKLFTLLNQLRYTMIEYSIQETIFKDDKRNKIVFRKDFNYNIIKNDSNESMNRNTEKYDISGNTDSDTGSTPVNGVRKNNKLGSLGSLINNIDEISINTADVTANTNYEDEKVFYNQNHESKNNTFNPNLERDAKADAKLAKNNITKNNSKLIYRDKPDTNSILKTISRKYHEVKIISGDISVLNSLGFIKVSCYKVNGTLCMLSQTPLYSFPIYISVYEVEGMHVVHCYALANISADGEAAVVKAVDDLKSVMLFSKPPVQWFVM